MRDDKPAGKDPRLYDALSLTNGWNPILPGIGSCVRFRCMNCGTQLSIAPKDMQGEFEQKCPVCKHVHVVNRNPGRWGSQHNLDVNKRMLLR